MSNQLLETTFKDYKVIKRLLGGRSNISYLIEKDDKKYVLRLNDTKSIFVNRNDEIEALRVAEELDITSKTIKINDEYKLSEYLEGEDLSSAKFSYGEVCRILKKLHHSSGKFSHDFDILGRLAKYENELKEVNPLYYKYKEFFINKYSKYEIKVCKCHNDAQDANFIKSNGKIYLIDFEFSANNDYYYDLASFSTDFDKNLILLNTYLGRVATIDEIRHVVLCRISICLMWHLVASIKDELKMSKTLQINFKEVASGFLKTVEELINKYF